MMERVRVRFAPSPTGFLHVGNARTALFNWLFARQNKGVFILRVEDTDIERSAGEYETRLIEDLRWVGLDWDEGPDVGGEHGPYRQSERVEIYRAHTRRLLDEGKAYYCFCSQEELEREREKALAEGRMPVYSGKCRPLSPYEAQKRVEAGEQATVRLSTRSQGSLSYEDLVRGRLTFDLALIGDPVIVRSNGLPAYNYAVVIDDFLMKITHVIRGEDHISNTPRQLLASEALGFSPPQFAHLSLVLGKDNTRLSKRHGATSVDQFGKEGILPSALFNYLALLGWAPPDGQEVLTGEELVSLFNLKKVSRSSAVFDYDKLYWLNRQHMKRLAPRERAERAFPFFKQAGLMPQEMTAAHWAWLKKALEAFVERVDKFSDLPSQFSIFFDFSPSRLDEEAREVLRDECAAQVIKLFGEKIAGVEKFDYEAFTAMTQEIKAATGCKGKSLFRPLRVALTSSASGLDLDKFIPLIEDGTRLDLPRPIKNCSQRVSEMIAFLYC